MKNGYFKKNAQSEIKKQATGDADKTQKGVGHGSTTLPKL
jgi:hypothetical protein